MDVRIENMDKKDAWTGQHFCLCGRFFESDGRLQHSISFHADPRLPDLMTLCEEMRAAVNHGIKSYIQKAHKNAEEAKQEKIQ